MLIQMPASIFRDPMVGAAAIRVLGIIIQLHHQGAKTSISMIARAVGVSRPAVIRQLRILKAADWLDIIQQVQPGTKAPAPSIYSVKWPDRMVQQVVQSDHLASKDAPEHDTDFFEPRTTQQTIDDQRQWLRAPRDDADFAGQFAMSAAETIYRLRNVTNLVTQPIFVASLDNPSTGLGGSERSSEGGVIAGKSETVGEKEETQPLYNPPIVPPYAPSLKSDFVKIWPLPQPAGMSEFAAIEEKCRRDIIEITGIRQIEPTEADKIRAAIGEPTRPFERLQTMALADLAEIEALEAINAKRELPFAKLDRLMDEGMSASDAAAVVDRDVEARHDAAPQWTADELKRNADGEAAKLVDDAKAARRKPLACAARAAESLKAGTAPKDRLSSAAVALAEPWSLPDDWRALAEARLQAAVPGARHDWTTEAEDFRNFHLATGKRWASWKHVWQTWYSRTVKSIAEKAARAAANEKRYGPVTGAPKRQGFLRKIHWTDAVQKIEDAGLKGATPKEKDDFLIAEGIDPISRRG